MTYNVFGGTLNPTLLLLYVPQQFISDINNQGCGLGLEMFIRHLGLEK